MSLYFIKESLSPCLSVSALVVQFVDSVFRTLPGISDRSANSCTVSERIVQSSSKVVASLTGKPRFFQLKRLPSCIISFLLIAEMNLILHISGSPKNPAAPTNNSPRSFRGSLSYSFIIPTSYAPIKNPKKNNLKSDGLDISIFRHYTRQRQELLRHLHTQECGRQATAVSPLYIQEVL